MAEGYFCAIGQGYKGRHEIDLKGKYVVPGFMDGLATLKLMKLEM